MGFKKTIKRISALGVGASMVGATIFGAMAAELATYPNQYVKDGKFLGVLVVGDKAAAEDVIGVSDIAVSLQFAATKPAESDVAGVAAEGDAWKVGTSTKIFEIGEELSSVTTNVETLRNVTTFIDDSELKALASGVVSNGKGIADFNQYLYLLGPGSGPNSGFVRYAEDDLDVTSDFLYFRSGHEIGRYLFEFTTSLESDVDDSAGSQTSTGLYLTDYEDVDLEFFGKPYTIVQARRTAAVGNNVKLIMMGGAVRDTLSIGETKTYTIDGKDYEVTVDFIDSNSAKLTVNGENTRDLLEGETDKLADGTTVGISEILYQDYAGGVQSTEFFLGAQKVELRDTNVKDVDSSNTLKIDDETIDDAYVVIEGSDDNTTFKIDRIHVNMTADDDFYIPPGGKLSENPDLDEPQVLFTNNWDIEYKGLKEEPLETIEIVTSGNKRYKLKFMDGGGNMAELPLVEATAASNPEFGEKDKALINVEDKNITKDDYLILTDASEARGSRKSYVLQYKGADKITSDNPKLKFKDLGSGDSIEQSYTNSSPLAILKIGGADYRVYDRDDSRGSLTTNDFEVRVDLDASGAISGTGGTNLTVNITTMHGMEIGIENASVRGGGASAGVNFGTIVSFKTPDNSREGGTTEDFVETLQATDFVVNITANSDTKVALALLTGYTSGQRVAGTADRLSLRTPDGQTNVAYGYTSYGAFITHSTPASEPATIKIEYPKKQREALVYITTKGTSFVKTAAPSGGPVTIQRIDVGATKLASEVSDINAVNSILVGGPCANAAAADVMGNPADCTEGFTPGVGKIQLYEVGSGNVAMLVAGYNAADTRNAATVVANYQDYAGKLKGSVVEVTKTQAGMLDVAKPSSQPVPVEEEAMEGE